MKNLPIASASATSPNTVARGETDSRLQRDGNNFNFLRILFAATVIFTHSFELIDGNLLREPLYALCGTTAFSTLGVFGFFLISGFLIVRSWQSNPGLWPYFKKRILRIYPAFIVAFLISVLVVGALGTALPDYYGALSYRALLRQMLFLQLPFVQELRMFEGHPYQEVNGAMWTISYEFICYCGVALLGLIGVTRKPWLWLGLTLVLCALYPFKSDIAALHFRGESIVKLFVRDKGELSMLATYFFVGGCFFLFLSRIRFSKALALLALALLIPSLFSSALAGLALAVLYGYILFWFAFLQIPLLDRFKYQSDVSYGLYLYGWPVQKLLTWYFPAITSYALFPIALIISYGLGYASWKLIEKPALQLKRRVNHDPRLLKA